MLRKKPMLEIALIDPKFPRNVGTVMRLASCYGASRVWFTGNRVKLQPEAGKRLPREERMKAYQEVEIAQYDYFFDALPKNMIPVAVEVRENAEPLWTFNHPDNAVYVFGPEDGSIPQTVMRHCHRFVVIPTRHCLNLATAVATVLYDRQQKEFIVGNVDVQHPGKYESRGPILSASFPEEFNVKDE